MKPSTEDRRELSGRVVRDFLADRPEIAQALGVTPELDDQTLYSETMKSVSFLPLAQRRIIMDALYQKDDDLVLPPRPYMPPQTVEGDNAEMQAESNQITPERRDQISTYHRVQAAQLYRQFDAVLGKIKQAEMAAHQAQQVMRNPNSLPNDVDAAVGRVQGFVQAVNGAWKGFQENTMPKILDHLGVASNFSNSPAEKSSINSLMEHMQRPTVLQDFAHTIKEVDLSFEGYREKINSGLQNFSKPVENDDLDNDNRLSPTI